MVGNGDVRESRAAGLACPGPAARVAAPADADRRPRRRPRLRQPAHVDLHRAARPGHDAGRNGPRDGGAVGDLPRLGHRLAQRRERVDPVPRPLPCRRSAREGGGVRRVQPAHGRPHLGGRAPRLPRGLGARPRCGLGCPAGLCDRSRHRADRRDHPRLFPSRRRARRGAARGVAADAGPPGALHPRPRRDLDARRDDLGRLGYAPLSRGGRRRDRGAVGSPASPLRLCPKRPAATWAPGGCGSAPA